MYWHTAWSSSLSKLHHKQFWLIRQHLDLSLKTVIGNTCRLPIGAKLQWMYKLNITMACKCSRSMILDSPAVKFGFVNWVRLSNEEAEKVSLEHLQGSLKNRDGWIWWCRSFLWHYFFFGSFRCFLHMQNSSVSSILTNGTCFRFKVARSLRSILWKQSWSVKASFTVDQ